VGWESSPRTGVASSYMVWTTEGFMSKSTSAQHRSQLSVAASAAVSPSSNSAPSTNNGSVRVARWPQAEEITGLDHNSIWDRLNPKSPRHDPTFPRPFALGDGARAVGFLQSELEEWVLSQAQKRLDSANAAERSKRAQKLVESRRSKLIERRAT
jgi:prophage regulatory protein